MKILVVKITALVVMLTFLSFSFSHNKNTVVNLSGKWNLTIDKKINGNLNGNNGCDEITFVGKKDNIFRGEYSSCSGSSNAKTSQFKGQVFVSSRGKLVTMVQDNSPTNYYAAWSSRMLDKGTIKGIWTDVEGNQGDFKLTKN